MRLVIMIAFVVGGASVFGALAGFTFKNAPARVVESTMAASGGIMLASAVVGLLVPAMDYAGHCALPVLLGGIFGGAGSMLLIARLTPRLTKRFELTQDPQHVLLFATAIAVHNFPEGLAAGVGFGTEETARAVAVALGIALQNLPEGMVTVTPLLAFGVPPVRALMFGVLAGASEIIATLLGYFAVHLCAALLPIALSFAGGCMLFVIISEMIPASVGQGKGQKNIIVFLSGFCLMLAMDHLLTW